VHHRSLCSSTMLDASHLAHAPQPTRRRRQARRRRSHRPAAIAAAARRSICRRAAAASAHTQLMLAQAGGAGNGSAPGSICRRAAAATGALMLAQAGGAGNGTQPGSIARGAAAASAHTQARSCWRRLAPSPGDGTDHSRPLQILCVRAFLGDWRGFAAARRRFASSASARSKARVQPSTSAAWCEADGAEAAAVAIGRKWTVSRGKGSGVRRARYSFVFPVPARALFFW
jgi:hypothetical protein